MFTLTINPLLKLVRKTSGIQPNEWRATLTSFSIAFLLMSAYFVLRPVRDAMASDWSDTEVSMLWNIQFFVSLALIAAYGWLTSKVPFKFVVPLVYALFAGSFTLFFWVSGATESAILVNKVFYVWVSAFSLLHISLFWSLMSDTFSADQGKRLFAIIAAGASAGAIIGPLVPTLFATRLGLESLMLIASLGLLLVLPLVFYLHRLKSSQLATGTTAERADTQTDGIGAKWYAGFGALVANPYLLRIAAFILVYVFLSSFIYFEQKNILADYPRAERAQLLGLIDWAVNTLTFVTAFFVTGRIVNRLGMVVALTLLPLLLVVGFILLAITPTVLVLAGVQILRRTSNYAITRPAREMLFSRVSQQERYQAKPVIDVAVYRGGDALSGTLFALLSEGLGLGLAMLACVGAALSVLWARIGQRLGQAYDGRLATNSTELPEPQVAK